MTKLNHNGLNTVDCEFGHDVQCFVCDSLDSKVCRL